MIAPDKDKKPESEIWTESIEQIIDEATPYKPNIKPDSWNEKYRYMPNDTPFPGKFSYDRTPWAREIVNRFSPYDPAQKIAFMKGAQIGASATVLEAGIGFRIDVSPTNIVMLMGHEDLATRAMTERIEPMLQSTGLNKIIQPGNHTSKRTGDTSARKEFPGGKFSVGYAGNHKLLRQESIQVMIVDDFEAAKAQSKESGSTMSLIEQRQAAYGSKRKLVLVSTPELKHQSNIEPAFLAGDQRYYYVPCPCCGEYIILQWTVFHGNERYGGVTWQTDKNGKLIPGSVGYTCQKCGGFFDDSHKYNMNLAGEWRPTADPSEPNYVSYHLSALYAPPGMYSWEDYVARYLRIENMEEGGLKESERQTFANVVLGETYEQKGEAPSANKLMENIRRYKPGEVPESLSEKDGNGKIVLLTCAADLNGKVDDARLDYEVLAWSETGASYSVDVGSIGSFVPRENSKEVSESREPMSYEVNNKRSVWPEFEKVLDQRFDTDTGRQMKVLMTGIDAPGHFAKQAYGFLDDTNFNVVALKGINADKYVPNEKDVPFFKKGRERSSLYMVEVNRVKDDLAGRMALKWDSKHDESQPPGFMNYPQQTDGKYTYAGYFQHFESEHRIVKDTGQGPQAMWVKKNSAVQNHFWDVHVYNVAVRDIVVDWVCRSVGMKPPFAWRDYVEAVFG